MVMEFHATRNLPECYVSHCSKGYLGHAYSNRQDIAVIYELKTKASSMKQGTMSVTDYYNVMTGLWLEIYHYQYLKMKCSDDVKTLQEFVKCEYLIFWLF